MIEVKNLVKYYGKHTAVDHISFTVETGKVVGFLGPNGAGKSTTMNMITGYIAPSKGTVLIDGIDILEEPERAKAHIGYLPEVPPLYPDLRVREYLHFVAELKGVPRKMRDMAVYQVMKKTMTAEVSERLIRHLSKGYRQRVGFAGAMLGEPDILILDEPTVGLDPGQIIEIRKLIRELSREHTILLSSHIMQEISAVCDEIIIINNGKVIACDTPENLTAKMVQRKEVSLLVKGECEEITSALEKIETIDEITIKETKEEYFCEFTLSSGEDVREQVFFAMAELGCPIYEMRELHSTLEDAFLALTESSDEERKDKETNEQLSEAEIKENAEEQSEAAKVEEKETAEGKEREEEASC